MPDYARVLTDTMAFLALLLFSEPSRCGLLCKRKLATVFSFGLRVGNFLKTSLAAFLSDLATSLSVFMLYKEMQVINSVKTEKKVCY